MLPLFAAQTCSHPLLVIGAGANRKLTSNMLRQFVDEIGIPFCDTMMGKGVIDSSAHLVAPCSIYSYAWRHARSRHMADIGCVCVPCAQHEIVQANCECCQTKPSSACGHAFAQKLSTGFRGPGNKMYMGTAAISDGDYIHHAINHSDLIILVGHDVRPCI